MVANITYRDEKCIDYKGTCCMFGVFLLIPIIHLIYYSEI